MPERITVEEWYLLETWDAMLQRYNPKPVLVYRFRFTAGCHEATQQAMLQLAKLPRAFRHLRIADRSPTDDQPWFNTKYAGKQWGRYEGHERLDTDVTDVPQDVLDAQATCHAYQQLKRKGNHS